MTKLLIIGGSDAGISAALRAKEVDAQAEVCVIVADSFPNYSICGLPFYLSGEVPDWHALAHRTADDIRAAGIHLLLNQTAQRIDANAHQVTVISANGQSQNIAYDRLLLATGATSIRPAIRGLDLAGVYTLHWMDDSFAVQKYLNANTPRSAVIIGGGYIGVEMADALTLRGIAVTLIEHGPSVLKTVESSLGDILSAELQQQGVNIVTGVAIEELTQEGTQIQVKGSHGFSTKTEMVLVAVGVRPVADLAASAGVETGIQGAIRVTRSMETNVAGIYAAGDCVETWHRLLRHSTYLPLGTTAHKQGRVAGETMLGGQREFAGTLGTQVVKVFEKVAARTGLKDTEAASVGLDPLTVESTFWDHKVYYPGAHEVRIRVTGDRNTGRLLGAQMVGHVQGEIAKRIDIFATALFHEMSIDAVSDLDLSYTPPLSSPWDPVQMSAQAWQNAAKSLRVQTPSIEHPQPIV